MFEVRDMVQGYTRKQLSDKLGISPGTLRYYETAGIIPRPARTPSGYRLYTDDDIARLRFILKAKDKGFRLKEIEAMFQRASGDAAADILLIQDQISLKIDELTNKIAGLEALKGKLEALKRDAGLAECGLIRFLNGRA